MTLAFDITPGTIILIGAVWVLAVFLSSFFRPLGAALGEIARARLGRRGSALLLVAAVLLWLIVVAALGAR